MRLKYKNLIYACFKCREVFEIDTFGAPPGALQGIKFSCPQCRGELHKMARNFRVPSSHEESQWKVAEVLSRSGLRYLGTSFP